MSETPTEIVLVFNKATGELLKTEPPGYELFFPSKNGVFVGHGTLQDGHTLHNIPVSARWATPQDKGDG